MPPLTASEVLGRVASLHLHPLQMDAAGAGLRRLMENQKQGALAQVIQSGCIRVNDLIRVTGILRTGQSTGIRP